MILYLKKKIFFLQLFHQFIKICIIKTNYLSIKIFRMKTNFFKYIFTLTKKYFQNKFFVTSLLNHRPPHIHRLRNLAISTLHSRLPIWQVINMPSSTHRTYGQGEICFNQLLYAFLSDSFWRSLTLKSV